MAGASPRHGYSVRMISLYGLRHYKHPTLGIRIVPDEVVTISSDTHSDEAVEYAEQIAADEFYAREATANEAAPAGEQEPPRTGKGSGAKVWADWCTAHGVEYPADAANQRDELIRLWDLHRLEGDG